MDQAIDNALTLFYKSSPLRTDFIQNEFRAYKASIDQAMAVYQQEVVHDERDECQSHLWKGEFGKEMRVMIPWAYYIRELCGGFQRVVLQGRSICTSLAANMTY